ncbi:probable calcium-binding protein CML36 isoform X2 [Rhodamnia argentea]|uniref:Probable calcium-binding protein CML36 isoform X1 n=1 Tax=Rhodamnia argentea TaxID=178133 RepID=A0A8B8N668_9MYRT|nr:probable calcium-binding protein CML36 isoform X1 [Rhodamnia argentea]XP_030517923.2 probable calcium-binding protein CML36 isoform X2 [Rhodamnia argentea]
MRIIKISSKALRLSPKQFFGSRKGRSVASRSDPPSFGSGTTSSSLSDGSSSSVHKREALTPTSVLGGGDWAGNLELSRAFGLIDRDGDGIISRKELEALLSRLGSRDEVAVMLSEVGCHGEGEDAAVSIEELLSRVGTACGPVCDDAELRETFEFFDEDHDGRITAEELLRVFTALGDDRCTLEDCRRMIAEVDKNGDGFVCFEDFAQMMDLQR